MGTGLSRSVSQACWGLMAAASQSHWVASPATDLGRYLILWAGVARLSATIAGTELFLRAKGAGPGLARAVGRPHDDVLFF